ncbi:MAG: hypothetical protein HY717_22690 [Planctomycetes bacterium]|nr:hypothetical protein [Planctomycetota bacterium]
MYRYGFWPFAVTSLILGLSFGPPRALATHPVPAVDLKCEVSGHDVILSWSSAANWTLPIFVVRDGVDLAATDLSALSFVDQDVPDGQHFYEIQERRFFEISTLGSCEVAVGDVSPFNLKCEQLAGARAVRLTWDPVVLNSLVTGLRVLRNDELIASLADLSTEYVDESPLPGLNRYVVYADIFPDRALLVGACSVSVEGGPSGFTCTVYAVRDVKQPYVVIDWCSVPLPRVAFSFFAVFRNGELIGKTLDCAFTDVPGRGEHHYKVIGVIGEPDPNVPLDGIFVGECTVSVPCCEGGGPPAPQDLVCAVALPGDGQQGGLPPDPNGNILPDFSVSLLWKNPVIYDEILIFRNGMPIARLAGTEESFIDHPPVFQAHYLYEVRGVVGALKSDPAVCEIGNPSTLPPPQDFACQIDDRILGPAGAPFPVVLLTWVNPVRYAGLVLSRDGAVIAKLPGDAMAYRDFGLPLGAHLYTLFGLGADGQASPSVSCTVDTGGGFVPPVRNLNCLAEGTTAVLSWENGGVYEKILIGRSNNEVLATLPGDETAYKDPGLTPGTLYTYSVSGWVNGQLSAPAFCSVLIGGQPPENLLFFSNSFNDLPPAGANQAPPEEPPPGRITCLARNAEAIQGWSFGVQSDPAFLVPEKVDLTDTATAQLNGGAGPTFLSLNLYKEGITMGVVIDETNPADTLPPPPDQAHALAHLLYSPGEGAQPGGAYPVRYSETLGGPPVAVIFVVKGFEAHPATLPGLVFLPPAGAPLFIRGDSNGDGEVDMSDALVTLGYLFLGKSAIQCLEAANANGGSEVNIADPIYTLQWKFLGAPPPPAPFPSCGFAEIAVGCDESTCAGPLN